MARVLVTGAASGIGAGVAQHLAAEGWQVVRSDHAPAAGVLPHDVTNEHDWSTVFAEHGPFAALVNSAGVRTRHALVDLPLAEWERVVRINLTGTFLGIREFARSCIAHTTPGAVVVLASVNAFSAVAKQPHYVASKAGVAMLVKAAALELAEHKIRINAIAPGPIDTPMLAERLATTEGRQWLEAKVPMGRIGTVHDCSSAVAFLLSDHASYITGATLPIDGGWLTQ